MYKLIIQDGDKEQVGFKYDNLEDVINTIRFDIMLTIQFDLPNMMYKVERIEK